MAVSSQTNAISATKARARGSTMPISMRTIPAMETAWSITYSFEVSGEEAGAVCPLDLLEPTFSWLISSR